MHWGGGRHQRTVDGMRTVKFHVCSVLTKYVLQRFSRHPSLDHLFKRLGCRWDPWRRVIQGLLHPAQLGVRRLATNSAGEVGEKARGGARKDSGCHASVDDDTTIRAAPRNQDDDQETIRWFVRRVSDWAKRTRRSQRRTAERGWIWTGPHAGACNWKAETRTRCVCSRTADDGPMGTAGVTDGRLVDA